MVLANKPWDRWLYKFNKSFLYYVDVWDSGPEKFESDWMGFCGEFVMVVFLLLALSHNIFYSLNKKASLKQLKFDKEIRLGLCIVVCITLDTILKI